MTDNLTILTGNCLDHLRSIPDESVQTCVTSPPYWGLRDYGTATWEGGNPNCDHARFLGGRGEASEKQITSSGTQKYQYKDACQKCGAKRTDNQLGLEKTPSEYIAKLVDVFREVRRVLMNDGTLWIVIGDSYNAAGRSSHGTKIGYKQQTNRASANGIDKERTTDPELKPKDLCGIPWRVAFALQADGWYLRCDVIWNKPNPMPESVTDRPTKAHEYIFLLSKSPKYYYDATAIREPASPALLQQIEDGYNGHATKDFEANGVQNASDTKSRIIQSHRNRIDKQRGHSRKHAGFNARWDKLSVDEQRMCGSNKRSVWTVAPANFKESHFATFPPDLIKPCILAGCPISGVVLDPFAGSFTTCAVALELGRRAIGIELNPQYVELGRQRCAVVTPGLPLA